MTNMFRKAAFAAASAGALMLAANAASAQANLTGETSSPGNSPHLMMIHLADVAAREGVADIQVQEGQTATNSIVNVAEGKSDMVTAPTILYFLLEAGRGPFSAIGEDGAALAANVQAIAPYNAGAYGLITPVSSGIQSYQDLAGKTVWNGPPRGAALTVGRQTITFGSGGFKDGEDYKGYQTNWGELPSVLVDGSADAVMVPITSPSDRVVTMLSTGDVNIISVPKDIFEGEAMQRFFSAPGNAPVVIPGENLGYGEDQGVNLISEDNVFRSPGVPFATMVRAGLDFDTVKALTATYIASLDELKQRAPYGGTVNFDVLDQKTTGFCGGLTLKYHPGAVAAWEEAGYDVPDCAKPE
ncbi:TAXI family TRAP transporter solute-binding subunit [Maritimibacter sp. UBA3975]|uniref:TAXI family TRAP transporter solute-binding subunit n=1 Tax=Maritimibacter sp. UBA3975 TaxID=1946833 RepID=UPI000C0AEFE9|nr:TAXI family TRAP transporter solute-binding subunit [Maritimibacter sp. UBA3975]MAM59920.1 C4-dicarboxylate ABC transporter substrate-binding protein [Maritimibacter sp.]|tara:strand:+ start:17196 stop:18266 length:1071 start_codon:yes stop_codon:yes gene_type:complete